MKERRGKRLSQCKLQKKKNKTKKKQPVFIQYISTYTYAHFQDKKDVPIQFLSISKEKRRSSELEDDVSQFIRKEAERTQSENRRLLDALKAFGRRSLNNAVNTNHLVGSGGGVGGGMTSGGVIGGVGGVFGAGTSTTTPLGISRPFRTVTPLHRATPELNQLTVQVNEGTS